MSVGAENLDSTKKINEKFLCDSILLPTYFVSDWGLPTYLPAVVAYSCTSINNIIHQLKWSGRLVEVLLRFHYASRKNYEVETEGWNMATCQWPSWLYARTVTVTVTALLWDNTARRVFPSYKLCYGLAPDSICTAPITGPTFNSLCSHDLSGTDLQRSLLYWHTIVSHFFWHSISFPSNDMYWTCLRSDAIVYIRRQ